MARRMFLAAMLIAAGCGGEQGPAQLEVEMLSIDGLVDGATVSGAETATTTGERVGDQGTFFVEGNGLSAQLSACPLGDLDNTDPYGIGGGGRVDGPVPVPADAGVEDPTGLIGGVECAGRGLTICSGRSCGSFSDQELDLQIVEENGWRQLTASADGARGTVQISLRYREHH